MPVNETTQPNQKSKDLDNQRKESLSNFIKEKRYGKKSEDSEENQENKEKTDKKLDNDQKNSYIKDKDNDEDSTDENEKQQQVEDQEESEENTEELDEYEKVLDETFGGDPKKAVKSWKESQKNYTKLRQEKKQTEQQIEYLNNLVEQNPMLGDIIKTAAEKGDITKKDLQNFLSEGQQEPSGKPNKSSSESKLEIVDDGFDLNDVDESTLAESGYIDPDKKEQMSPSEWNILKRQAVVKYAEDQLPQRLANKAYQQFEQQIDEAQKKQKQKKRQQQIQNKNAERYEKGIERVINEFDLDFAGNEEHEQLLDEIESVAVNIRDPQDNDVIHPNAMYLATVQVMEDKGMNPGKPTNVDEEVQKAKQEADESFDKRTGFNANTKQPKQDEPETWADKMANRNLQQYKKEQEKRRKTGRINSSE